MDESNGIDIIYYSSSPDAGEHIEKVIIMLKWTLVFLVGAIIAAVLGFGGIAAGFATVAKVVFVLFLVLFVISLISRVVKSV